MTPKEKANELIESFNTVSEIISVIENGNPIESQYNFWVNVKLELIKL